MFYVEVSGLTKRYDATTVFEDIQLGLKKGEFATLLGPSGCGKSTLLRCLAGLTAADHGQIRVEGQDITHLAPQKRGIGMVFQSYALFPNMTVAENIAFGLKMQRRQPEEMVRRVTEAIRLVELSNKEHHYPHELSGGQRQRVALARALVVEPRILLLDEPLSALDARIRRSLREEIRDIQSRLGLTTVFVTHDQEEALTLSDRIFVMNQGRIVQEGSAETVYTQPATEFVARFMGSYNLLAPAEAKRLLGLELKGHLAIRPESIHLSEPGHSYPAHLGVPLTATIRQHQLLGNIIRYHVEAQGTTLLIDHLNRSADDLLPSGAQIALLIDRQQMREVH
ncbi:ABC transporter ATP-binding protein [Pseudogulbenkiania subflava]|uniref:Putative spermidine/putrescine transport system ATP-binding protein n=1 Tax=Pseudogulbenkiania subflava DSM 22618 TaxID=1123014 RepID=A0A1Y6C0W2_9NEIS|nr:ABC transporter ATP-binding protein [Pseudogulbenkiania subflava]SMF38605.1 putative spermidine/putrescine transport system ATP-binding protein [Pseudogulbenkiania subflava DSM 22618]